MILSRGEMVEIGGSFRLPEVMKNSGCKLHEIGTTNKTHLFDYEEAISTKTGAILICHTSNYEIKGFTYSPDLNEIVELARKHKIPVLYDLGSGSLIETKRFGSASEPEVSSIVEAGVDLVSFSGDKLLGGPQAGLIVGKKGWLQKCAKNHLLRALRLDKFMLKALQDTLINYLYNEESKNQQLETIQTLTESAAHLLERCDKFLKQLPPNLKAEISITPTKGKVGSGAYPILELESFALKIRPLKMKANRLGRKLREANFPVITYITDEAVLIDFRAVSNREEEIVRSSLVEILM